MYNLALRYRSATHETSCDVVDAPVGNAISMAECDALKRIGRIREEISISRSHLVLIESGRGACLRKRPGRERLSPSSIRALRARRSMRFLTVSTDS